MVTPHNEAKIGDIATTVLMPGDPMRAKFIAEHYLDNPVLFNDIRGMLGYTGTYNGKKVSVMGSGMGIPSMGIYSYELYKFFGVKKIIRVGSCGALDKDLKLFDIILVDKAISESNYAYLQNGSKELEIKASIDINNEIEKIANENNIKIKRGNAYTSDVFDIYREENAPSFNSKDAIVAEMESFALFHNAKVLNKEATCLLTVTDSPYISEIVSSEQREASFTEMIELALKSI